MTKPASIFASCLLAFSMPLVAAPVAAAQDATDYSLSIYNATQGSGDSLFQALPSEGTAEGYAVVRELRQLDLHSGSNSVQIQNVSRFIDASAVSFRSLSDVNGTHLLSQSFDVDPITLNRLVERHLGHSVNIEIGSGDKVTILTGTLLSSTGGMTLRLADGRIVTAVAFNRITFPQLPRGMASAPTLSWQIEAKKSGRQNVEIAYPTLGLAWRAEYTGWLASEDDCHFDFSAWALIANRSGSDFHNAHLNLVAGEPHRTSQPAIPGMMMAPMVPMGGAAKSPPRLQENAQGDYRAYRLDTPADLVNAAVLRIALFPSQTLACQRQYVFEGSALRVSADTAPITERSYGSDSQLQVQSTLTFKLDRAMPAGRLRMLQDNADGAADFVGEDQLANIPRNENVTIALGKAFNLSGERRQSDYRFDKDKRQLSETFAIRLKNHSDKAQSIVVREHLYRWTQWKISQSSAKFDKRDSDSIEFIVDVPPNGETALEYTVQYQWTAFSQ